MKWFCRVAAFALGGLAALALALLLPLLGAGLIAALTTPPGALQVGAALLAAVAMRPAPPAPVVVDVTDDALLYRLLVREVCA